MKKKWSAWMSMIALVVMLGNVAQSAALPAKAAAAEAEGSTDAAAGSDSTTPEAGNETTPAAEDTAADPEAEVDSEGNSSTTPESEAAPETTPDSEETIETGLEAEPEAINAVAAELTEAARKTMDVRKTLTAPVIDGKFDESFWSVMDAVEVPVGEGLTAPAKLGLLWDNQYLYIGMDMTDSALISSASGSWFDQDSVSLFFDPTLHQSTPYINSDMQAGFNYAPGTTTPTFHFGAALNNHAAKDEKNILRAIQTTDHGWSLEVAVPWTMLDMNPVQRKQLGFEAVATDRFSDDAASIGNSAWSAYQSSSFWNDTQGYGVLTLVDDNPVSGNVNPVLLQENFDSYESGTIPANWISDVNSGSAPFGIVKDGNGNGRMAFSGTASGKQSRVTAPVQWDNYSVEADLRFDSVLNSARWASLIFRGAADGKKPYNQMAIRQNGTYEVAYRKPDDSWSVIATGTSPALTIGQDYTLKVRVFDNNVKEYIKAKDEADYKLLVDKSFAADLLSRGKIGFQADQSSVSFDNLKVTRITADSLALNMPATVEALTAAVPLTGTVVYSDGITEELAMNRVQLYASDESIAKVSGGQLYAIKPGTVTMKAVFANAEWSQTVTVTPSTAPVAVTSLTHDTGYTLATTNMTLDPATLSFAAVLNDFTTGTVSGADLTWTSTDEAVSVEEGKLVVKQRGVHTITGKKDGASVTLLIVAKDAADAEYVLYENNFDNTADGALPTDWKRIEGTTASKAAVKSGLFEIDALASPDNPSRVLLPDFLNQFGNYKIEADVTNTASNDTARWNSIMYRVQNNNYPYYQMAVRKDATAVNGVEFAERTPENAWNVMNRGSFSEAINADKMYHYTVVAYGNRVRESINDMLLIDTANAGAYAKGGIGLQANGSKMKVDNLRVTLQLDELPPLPGDRYVNVAQADTRISLAPSVVTDIATKQQLESYTGSALPATVILHVNDDLKVVAASGGQAIMTLDEALETIDSRMIPAFYVETEAAVDALVSYLKHNELEDAFVMSDKPELVKRARLAHMMLRGIVDYSKASIASNDDLMNIRAQATLNKAKIVMLPQAATSKANVAYLQERTIVVWTKETGATNAQEQYVNLHRIITAGSNGIVTSAVSEAFRALNVYTNETTLVRKPYMIGHRGLPTAAPENTIISNELALDAGADFIENDIYLSKDGHLVIIHDSVLESTTTDGTGSVESYTLEELRKFQMKQVAGTNYPEARIATLDEQIDLARERGAMVYAEIKTATPAAVDAFVALVREKHAEDIINVMSFDTNQLARLAAQMPDMPLGLLTSGYANENAVNSSLRETLKVTQYYDSTFNTSYSGLGPKFIEAAHARGLIVSPWTYNNYADFKSIFLQGGFGITTDYSNWASKWVYAVEPEKVEYTLETGKSQDLKATVRSYDQTLTPVEPTVVLLDDSGTVTADANHITASKVGVTYALLRYTATIDSDHYDVYTQPITIRVNAPSTPGNGNSNGGGGTIVPGDGGNSTNDNGSSKSNNENNNEGNGSTEEGTNNNGSEQGSGSEGTTTEKPSFSDITGHWASSVIMLVAEHGFMNGYQDGTFKPNNSITRAEFITVVARLLALPDAQGSSSFNDVAADAWYAKYVNSAVEAGWVQGFADHTFRPSQNITREEAVVILYRALQDKLVLAGGEQLTFTDSGTIAAWAQEAVLAMTSNGLLGGYPDDTIRPKANLTRAEVAAMIMKFLG
ncbi:glycerophosphoryl diester phosphodiesterase [Paenibacillus cellulosilyticus]|uniref:Glycerophosphoryl diester phosphodiesterase n=1 Tax=Paenibacillus cellulosilyticus TaxID=375489 RepID=A0A2V2YM96_9BACL|nr:S-layer homology domain-containing protein [Paenibacillus cellulosilyticus]PWV95535.1 glycerophosphoryl diester phosphodiesterase [Paenibacillus cellulosilyticus]QKS47384.1 S-layer homology domain-containing protein [Paenibacillus cellulosilyticus]